MLINKFRELVTFNHTSLSSIMSSCTIRYHLWSSWSPTMLKIKSIRPGTENSISKFKIMRALNKWLYFSWLYTWHVEFFVNPNNIFSINVCLAYLRHGTGTRRLSEHLPAATADHMTKNIPTAILFKEEGSKPRCFRMGSTTLSFRGISKRMSTASNMVSQAAGKRNVN